MDVCAQNMAESFDFIYSVAVLHMLLEDEDRKNYLAFIRKHLVRGGYGLILTMGEGGEEMCSDTETAFDPAVPRQVFLAPLSCPVYGLKVPNIPAIR